MPVGLQLDKRSRTPRSYYGLTFTLKRGHDIPFIVRSSKELGENFDRLPAREQIVKWNTCNARHLDVVYETHQFIEQSLGEVCILSGGQVR